MGDRTQSAASDHSVSNAGSALPSPITGHAPRTSSPFKPRGKALAAVLGGSSRNGSTTEIVPREINLPYDPFVNGQPLEVFLYKDATECPICFLTYPPYLNHTRCCDQAICSECFVQIKRPDPHFPEGHNENSPNHNPEASADQLVCEPACCPYCTQPEFGVTYEAPPFRRGLTYGVPAPFGALGTAMSSSSSLNSGTPSASPAIGSPISTGSRRRTQSLSATSPNVITTDRIRPEWATKLQTARAHLARRAAAATALHTAAFLMNNTETRPGRGRFGRRSAGPGLVLPPSANPSPGGANNDGGNSPATPSQGGPDPSAAGAPGRDAASGIARSRLEDLEEMMFMEAIRLSLASEEERKRKEEKEGKKEAKKREKEDRKAAKAAARQTEPYDGPDGRSGQSSASGSSLSLPGLGFGRKRGNSGASNLRVEASVASAMATSSASGNPPSDAIAKDKGKGIDRSLPSTPEGSGVDPTSEAVSIPAGANSAARPIPSPHQSAGPSHLRQMSSASSVSSSLIDSQPGSYITPSHLQDPRASGLSLGSRSGASEDGGDHDRDPSASTEPMFNFRSLAEVVGVSLEGENAGRRLSLIEAERKSGEAQDVQTGKAGDIAVVEERVENSSPDNLSGIDQSVSTLRAESTWTSRGEDSQVSGETAVGDDDRMTPPKVTITPETPALYDTVEDVQKQLGYETTVEHAREVSQ